MRERGGVEAASFQVEFPNLSNLAGADASRRESISWSKFEQTAYSFFFAFSSKIATFCYNLYDSGGCISVTSVRLNALLSAVELAS